MSLGEEAKLKSREYDAGCQRSPMADYTNIAFHCAALQRLVNGTLMYNLIEAKLKTQERIGDGVICSTAGQDAGRIYLKMRRLCDF